MHHFFHFQNNLVHSSKDRKSAVHETSPFRMKEMVLWLKLPTSLENVSIESQSASKFSECKVEPSLQNSLARSLSVSVSFSISEPELERTVLKRLSFFSAATSATILVPGLSFEWYLNELAEERETQRDNASIIVKQLNFGKSLSRQ